MAVGKREGFPLVPGSVRFVVNQEEAGLADNAIPPDDDLVERGTNRAYVTAPTQFAFGRQLGDEVRTTVEPKRFDDRCLLSANIAAVGGLNRTFHRCLAALGMRLRSFLLLNGRLRSSLLGRVTLGAT